MGQSMGSDDTVRARLFTSIQAFSRLPRALIEFRAIVCRTLNHPDIACRIHR